MSVDTILKTIAAFGDNWQSGKVFTDWQNDIDYYAGGYVQHNGNIYFATTNSGPNILNIGIQIPGRVDSASHWMSLQEVLQMTTTTNLSTRWTFVGDIQELHRPSEDLPFGWFALFGDGFPKDSVQGKQLLVVKNQPWWQQYQQSVPIIEMDDLVYLPNWKTEDGRMPITRPVDNVGRTVGSLEQDAIRNLTGEWSRGSSGPIGVPSEYSYFTGVYKRGSVEYEMMATGTGSHHGNSLVLDASLAVPTSAENIMLNRGTTIAMFLNVPKP